MLDLVEYLLTTPSPIVWKGFFEKANNFILVDPLDGTKEFINRTGEFTVNIAYIQNGTPTHGVVYAPAIKRLFSTDQNGKSYETIKLSAKADKR